MGLKDRTLRKKLSASSPGRAGSSRRLDLGDGHDLTLLPMTHDASMTHLHIEPPYKEALRMAAAHIREALYVACVMCVMRQFRRHPSR